MKKLGMYEEPARYYDLIYSFKDYKKESERLKVIIRKYKRSKGNSLLEVACGTGKHLEYLKKDFSCTGLDLNEEMLRLARKRFHGIKFIRANMIDFQLDRNFDIITCLFSSIGYVKTYKNLEKTLKNFSKHLKVGGVVIIEPWFTKATYKLGSPHLKVYQDNDIKIVRAGVSNAKNGISISEMHYLVAERGKKVKYFVSTEELGMFETSKTLQLMKSAGFDTKFLKSISFDKRRGLFVGVKL
jgi:ubiquinone/menaquinone biosynthesis C-methylase UbiE